MTGFVHPACYKAGFGHVSFRNDAGVSTEGTESPRATLPPKHRPAKLKSGGRNALRDRGWNRIGQG